MWKWEREWEMWVVAAESIRKPSVGTSSKPRVVAQSRLGALRMTVGGSMGLRDRSPVRFVACGTWVCEMVPPLGASCTWEFSWWV